MQAAGPESCEGTGISHVIGVDRTAPLMSQFPLYNQDLEAQGFPEAVRDFRRSLDAADALLVLSPEYNGSLTPLLVNALAWASRPMSNEDPQYTAFKGKPAAILSVSPGPLGGVRGLPQATYSLNALGANVIETRGFGNGYQLFDGDSLREERHLNTLKAVCHSLEQYAAFKQNSEVICAVARRQLLKGCIPGENGSLDTL